MRIISNRRGWGRSEDYLRILARRKRKWFFAIILMVFIPLVIWCAAAGINLMEFVWQTTAASGIFAAGVSLVLDRTIQ